MAVRPLLPLAVLAAASTAALALARPQAARKSLARTRFAAGAPRPFAAGGTAPQCNLPDGGAGGTCNMQYYGGAVISNVKVYVVFWNNAVDSTTKAGIAGFYQAATNNAYLDWLTEYRTDVTVKAGPAAGQPGTQQLVGRGAYAGSFTLSPSTVSICTGGAGNQLYDNQITNELDAQISAGTLPPPDANTIYMIYFPPGCMINDRTAATPDPIGNSCVDFCAYHSTAQSTRGNGDNGVFYYAVMPDFGPGSGCDLGCGSGVGFDNLTSASAHELVEAISDAQVGLAGDTLAPPLAWYDPYSAEVGDMCNQAQDNITSADGVTTYVVQQIYSQKDYSADPTSACVTTRFETNDFAVFMDPNTATLQAGNSLNVPILSEVSSGTPGPLALTVSGLPPGVTAHFDTTAPAVGNSVNLIVTAAANAVSSRDAMVIVKATSSSQAHTAALLLQVQGSSVVGANDFTLSLSGPSAKVAPGKSTAFTLTTAVTAGSAEGIALSAAGLPAGVTASFNPKSVIAGSTATVTLAAAATAPEGGGTIAVTGKSASVPGGHSATAQLTVDGLPTVTISNPVSGATVSGTVNVGANGLPGSGTTMASVILKIDGARAASGTTSASKPWDTTAVDNGHHQIDAVATDADDGSAQVGVAVTVLNPPTVALAAPPPATAVMGSVALGASATPPKGTTVASVALLVDGASIASGPSPLSFTWDSKKVKNGAHAITASATGADGSTGTSAPVTLTVSNPSSGGCSSAGGTGLGGLWGLLLALGAAYLRRTK